jgi:para-nitrobenzyl esterase
MKNQRRGANQIYKGGNGMKRAISIFVVFLFFACGAAIAGQGQGNQLSWGPPEHARNDNWNKQIIKTKYGKLKGYQASNGTWVWKGVPYARPPLGELRWKAPEDPQQWAGVRDATEPCSECTQRLTSRTWITSDPIVGSEDCLFVDIYRPDTADENVPVYIWLHGGSNVFGSAENYDGAALAKRENIIVVVVQYRLGPLGWLSHPAFRDDENELDASGNFGILDQIQALKWVKENIDAFGGNPLSVTLGGESAGALDTLTLLISPKASGLFRAAVVESGGTPSATFNSNGTGDPKTNRMIDWLLVDDGTAADPAAAAAYRAGMTNDAIEEYLRGKTAEKIMRAHIAAGPSSAPFLDGNVVPAAGFYPTIATGNYNQVPLLVGTNRYEYKAYMRYSPYAPYAKSQGFPSGAYSWADAFRVFDPGDLTLDDVLPTAEDKGLYETISGLWTRQWRYAGADRPATAIKDENEDNPVYSYVFQWEGGGDPEREAFRTLVGSCHASELAFFFGWSDDLFGWGFSEGNRPGREALQGAMMDYLGSFVWTENPNSMGSPRPGWPQWSNAAGEPKVIVFDANLFTYEIGVENTTAMDNYSADIQAARALFPTAGSVFDFFGLK